MTAFSGLSLWRLQSQLQTMPTFAAAAVLFSTVFGATSEIPTVRVVLDTDLGDDIDDTWALSALLQAMAADSADATHGFIQLTRFTQA